MVGERMIALSGMNWPYIAPHTQGSPSSDITVVHDLGLQVSMSLIGISLLRIAHKRYIRSRQRDRSKLRFNGAMLREGRVIVDGTRIAPRVMRTPDGQNLQIEDAPLSLELGKRGHVLGMLVHEVISDGADYRKSGCACFGRLLPLHGRYRVVPQDTVEEAGGSPSLIPLGYFIVMAAVAGVVRFMDPGWARSLISSFWLLLALALALAVVAIVRATSPARTPRRSEDPNEKG
jgi:hypothetical protein